MESALLGEMRPSCSSSVFFGDGGQIVSVVRPDAHAESSEVSLKSGEGHTH